MLNKQKLFTRNMINICNDLDTAQEQRAFFHALYSDEWRN